MSPVLPDDDLIRQFPDIREIREIVGIYEIPVKDVEVPLKIKIIRIQDKYVGIASLGVRAKGQKEYYRDIRPYPSRDAALAGSIAGFFRDLQPGASIREIKNWNIL
ncbi:MAG: hypothetical protein WC342_09535 [Methanoregula sp.]|jgi:hypothetical protein